MTNSGLPGSLTNGAALYLLIGIFHGKHAILCGAVFKAEDAGGPTPARDDSAVWWKTGRKEWTGFMEVQYTISGDLRTRIPPCRRSRRDEPNAAAPPRTGTRRRRAARILIPEPLPGNIPAYPCLFSTAYLHSSERRQPAFQQRDPFFHPPHVINAA